MTRHLTLTALSLFALTLVGSASAAERPTLAVAYFANNSGDAKLDALGKGLADMLITDLSNVKSVQVVERARLQEVLGELKLSKSEFVDPKTAQRLGRGLAARYILTGAFAVQGGEMRVDARLIDVESGAVLSADKVEGKRDEFFALEKQLVDLLLRSLKLDVPFAQKLAMQQVATTSFDAWAAYAAGLDASDRGDGEEARRRFADALARDPEYRKAKTAMERLAVIFERDDQQRRRDQADIARTLDPEAPDFAAKVDAYLSKINDSEPDELRDKVQLLRFLVERDLAPYHNGFSRVPMDMLSLLSRFLQDPDTWDLMAPVCEWVITRYPTSPMPKPQCKVYLKTVDKMRAVDPDILRQSWAKSRDEADRFDHTRALYAVEEEIRALFRLCAERVKVAPR